VLVSGCALWCLFVVSDDFRDGVDGLSVGAGEGVFSSFECRMTHMNI